LIEDPDKYHLAMYYATPATGLPGKWFAAIQCRHRVDPATVPGAKKAQYDVAVAFGPRWTSRDGIVVDTKVMPKTWRKNYPNRSWPLTTAGRDRTYRAKVSAVYASGDPAAIAWLANMIGAFILPLSLAKVENCLVTQALIDALKRQALHFAGKVGEELFAMRTIAAGR
jgi:hypothetical protein